MPYIWKRPIDLTTINQIRKNTMMETLQIEVTGFGDDYLEATMPVNHRTKQPMGILHGGASVALAETVASIASTYATTEGNFCVGLEINANHIRKATSGIVIARTEPLHLGRSTQVWQIRIRNEQDKTVCISRITMSILSSD